MSKGKKRPHQDGSIFQDKDGVWWAQLPPDSEGKRPKRRAKTQREAQQLLAAMKRERERGVNLSVKQPTVEQFLETWLESVVGANVKPKTAESYAQIVRLYLVPEIGDRRLDQLQPDQVQAMLNRLLSRVSARTAQYARVVLRRSLDVAVKWGYVGRNVAALTDAPRVERREVVPLPPSKHARSSML